MSVQTSTQSLLIQEMGNETNAATKHEQTIEDTHLKVVFGLFSGEGAAVAHQIDEADCDAAVDVEDKVVLLGRCDGLNSKSIVEELGAWEVLLDEFLDELDAEIGVVSRLDTMADTGD
jgi:hypothetical protein